MLYPAHPPRSRLVGGAAEKFLFLLDYYNHDTGEKQEKVFARNVWTKA
jgi:hypothetical protein